MMAVPAVFLREHVFSSCGQAIDGRIAAFRTLFFTSHAKVDNHLTTIYTDILSLFTAIAVFTTIACTLQVFTIAA